MAAITNGAVSDAVWHSLIQTSTRFYNQIGRYNNRRAERKAVYVCISVCYLAMSLREAGVIPYWQGGFRRLSVLQESAIARFKHLHGIYHTDPC